MKRRAIISLGSNVEPRAEYLRRATDALSAFPETRFVRASSVVETEPVDVPPEFAALKFLNQVAVFETALEPLDFSRRMHAVEDALGRVRTVRNGPRTIDVDLVDFGGLTLDSPELTLPHPRAKEREFVLAPLRELGLANALSGGDASRAAVRTVAELVKRAGGRALLVGGCVRDELLGLEPKDFDVECFGISGQDLQRALSERFELDLVGISFGVIKLHHLDVDVAMPRRETKLGLGHRAFGMEYDPTLTIAEASARRDFTVNAIYKDPLTGEILDPWNGRADLERKILRHVSPHFREDPLRVLRGMQFVARFGLEPAPETVEICRGMTPEGLASERLFGEWEKLLTKGVTISKGLNFLRAVGWVKYYPELEKLIGCEQDPEWHPEGDVWNHTLCCLDAFARERVGGTGILPVRDSGADDLVVGLAVLCHDFGKPKCTMYDPVKKRIRSLGHDEEGVEPTLSFLKRLTNEERLLKEVPPLVRLHMRPFAMWKDKSSDGAIRRLAAKVVRIDRLIRVAAADDAGRPPYPSEPEPLKWLAEQAERLRVADSAPKPIVQGRDLIALGMKPGVEFGRILKAAYEAQLDGKFTDLKGGIQYVSENA